MKKLFILIAIMASSVMVYSQTTIDRAMSVWARNIINTNFTTSYANIALRAPIASPTFTGTLETDVLTVTGAASFAGGISLTATVREYTTIVTIDSTKIAGSASGELGHADGAVLVATAGAGYALEFVSAFLVYDYGAVDFAGGGNDLVIQVGVNGAQVAMSSAITAATLLTASADAMIRVGAIATETVYADAGIISLYAGTAYTNNAGTAKGALRVHITYRVHTTGL